MKIKQDEIKGPWIGMDDIYFDILDAISKEKNSKLKDFTVIQIKDPTEIEKIKIPFKIFALAKELSMSTDSLISKILTDFVIQYNFGYAKYKKGIINRIRKYPDLDKVSKTQLIKFILENE